MAGSTKSKIRELIMEALGQASLCWSDPYKAGTFDSSKCVSIGEKLANDIEAEIAKGVQDE